MKNNHASGPFGNYDRHTPGHILNNLRHFGIPLHIVERVSVGQEVIKLNSKIFAMYRYFVGIEQPLFHLLNTGNGIYDNMCDPDTGDYVLTLSSHSTPCMILKDAHDATPLTHSVIKKCLTNVMDDPFYKLTVESGAFFQGGSSEPEGQWFFVEFWKPQGAQAWLDGFNAQLHKARQEQGIR